jgi:hypothetical protein
MATSGSTIKLGAIRWQKVRRGESTTGKVNLFNCFRPGVQSHQDEPEQPFRRPNYHGIARSLVLQHSLTKSSGKSAIRAFTVIQELSNIFPYGSRNSGTDDFQFLEKLHFMAKFLILASSQRRMAS